MLSSKDDESFLFVNCTSMLGKSIKNSYIWSGKLATGYWLLATGYWLLATGYWLLATGYWLLAKTHILKFAQVSICCKADPPFL